MNTLPETYKDKNIKFVKRAYTRDVQNTKLLVDVRSVFLQYAKSPDMVFNIQRLAISGDLNTWLIAFMDIMFADVRSIASGISDNVVYVLPAPVERFIIKDIIERTKLNIKEKLRELKVAAVYFTHGPTVEAVRKFIVSSENRLENPEIFTNAARKLKLRNISKSTDITNDVLNKNPWLFAYERGVDYANIKRSTCRMDSICTNVFVDYFEADIDRCCRLFLNRRVRDMVYCISLASNFPILPDICHRIMDLQKKYIIKYICPHGPSFMNHKKLIAEVCKMHSYTVMSNDLDLLTIFDCRAIITHASNTSIYSIELKDVMEAFNAKTRINLMHKCCLLGTDYTVGLQYIPTICHTDVTNHLLKRVYTKECSIEEILLQCDTVVIRELFNMCVSAYYADFENLSLLTGVPLL